MKIQYLLFISALILFTSYGCDKQTSPEPELANVTRFSLEVAKSASLIRDRSYLGKTQSKVKKIGDVAVDSAGNVYVVDEYRRRIEVYNSNGLNIGSMGKAGGDPGEFQKPGTLTVVGKHLYAYDESLYRVNAYDLERSEFSDFTQLNVANKLGVDSLQNTYPKQFFVMADGNYLVGFQKVNGPADRSLHFYKINPEGEILSDQLISFKSKSLYIDDTMTSQVIMMLPYANETLLAIDSKNNLYTLNTVNFLIKVWDEKGNYLKAYDYPFQKRDLVESDVVEMFTNVNQRRAIRGADLPPEWPAVARLFVDDKDRLWVATITYNLDDYRWYVLAEDGAPLATFNLPREEEVVDVRDGALYVKTFNRRSYTDQVLRYRFSF